MENGTIIRTRGLSRDYTVGSQTVHALRDLDLAITEGEFVAIMGPSGSGKSTCMHLLGCLDTPSAGHYELDGDGNTMDFVIPTTDEEKLAANYREESKIRPKVNSSYDPSLSYTSRGERRKEWAIVGLLGQVPVRDSAVIPTSWTKMKNLESGIDLYYIK